MHSVSKSTRAVYSELATQKFVTPVFFVRINEFVADYAL
jgi:hypothetical protein